MNYPYLEAYSSKLDTSLYKLAYSVSMSGLHKDIDGAHKAKSPGSMDGVLMLLRSRRSQRYVSLLGAVVKAMVANMVETSTQNLVRDG